MKKFALLLLSSVLFPSFLFFYSCNDHDSRPQETVQEERTLNFTGEVLFLTGSNDTVSVVQVAVADDNQSRSEGLMNVNELPDHSGMLFVFSNDQTRSFWMANTPLPLDIIFVNSQMNIVRIHRNTQPFSQESIQSEAPARFVVEVNAGYTLEHDIREGMKIAIKGIEF